MEEPQDETKHRSQDDVREICRFWNKIQRHEAYVYPFFEGAHSKVTWKPLRTKQSIHAKVMSEKKRPF